MHARPPAREMGGVAQGGWKAVVIAFRSSFESRARIVEPSRVPGGGPRVPTGASQLQRICFWGASPPLDLTINAV